MKQLSRRHLQILKLHEKGLSNATIAKRIKVNHTTVSWVLRVKAGKPGRRARAIPVEAGGIPFKSNRSRVECSGCGRTPPVLPCPLCAARRFQQERRGVKNIWD